MPRRKTARRTRCVLEWMPMSERLPEAWETCLLTDGVDGFWTGFVDKEQRVLLNQETVATEAEAIEVTHWARLPSFLETAKQYEEHAQFLQVRPDEDVFDLIDSHGLSRKQVRHLDRWLMHERKKSPRETLADIARRLRLKPHVAAVAQQIWELRYG